MCFTYRLALCSQPAEALSRDLSDSLVELSQKLNQLPRSLRASIVSQMGPADSGAGVGASTDTSARAASAVKHATAGTALHRAYAGARAVLDLRDASTVGEPFAAEIRPGESALTTMARTSGALDAATLDGVSSLLAAEAEPVFAASTIDTGAAVMASAIDMSMAAAATDLDAHGGSMLRRTVERAPDHVDDNVGAADGGRPWKDSEELLAMPAPMGHIRAVQLPVEVRSSHITREG